MLDLSILEKTIKSLEDAISVLDDLEFMQSLDLVKQSIIKAGVIQNFEFTYEQCWKLMQRWIKINISPESSEPRTKKDLFRLAAKNNLIKDPLKWFDYLEARNNSAHTYDEDIANEVLDTARTIIDDAKYLLKQLSLNND